MMLCVYMYNVYSCTCVCTFVCMHISIREQSWVLFFLSILFGTGSQHFNWPVNVWRFCLCLPSCPKNIGHTCLPPHPAFTGSEDSSSGSHACAAALCWLSPPLCPSARVWNSSRFKTLCIGNSPSSHALYTPVTDQCALAYQPWDRL